MQNIPNLRRTLIAACLFMVLFGSGVAAQDPSPSVIDVRHMQRTSYSRFTQQCGRESRDDAPEGEAIEDRSEARDRAVEVARSGSIDETLLLARACYGEAGPPQPGRNDHDCIAMLAVIDARRGSMSRSEMIAMYAPRRFFPREADQRHRWISELQLDGRRPPSWPRPRNVRHHSHPEWRTYGCPRWLATVEQARSILRRYPRQVGPGPCSRVPDHWGGAMDDHRAIRGGWSRVTCGTTLNRFWAIRSDG